MRRTTMFVAAGILNISTAHAAPVLWNFDAVLGDLGTTAQFTSTPVGGGTITVTAFGPAGTHLFAKNDGVGERGLGVIPTPFKDGEVYPPTFLQLDLSEATVEGRDYSVEMSSIQPGETAQFWGSNVDGVEQTMLGSLAGNASSESATMVDLTGFRFFDFTAGPVEQPCGGCTPTVDLISVDNNSLPTVPEPATLLILGSALAALGFANRGRKGALDAPV